MSEQCRAGLGTLLSELVSTYSLLHQVPRCYSLLLQLNAQSPQQLIDMLALPDFSHRCVPSLHDAVSSLHPTSYSTDQTENESCSCHVCKPVLYSYFCLDIKTGPATPLCWCQTCSKSTDLSIDVRPVQKALISLLMSNLFKKHWSLYECQTCSKSTDFSIDVKPVQKALISLLMSDLFKKHWSFYWCQTCSKSTDLSMDVKPVQKALISMDVKPKKTDL